MIERNQHSLQLENWQRLSPLSVIFFIGKLIARIFKDALSALAPLAVIVFNSDNKLWMTVSVSGAVVTVVVVGSLLQYWFFKFRRDGNRILVNDGVFKKNHRVIQFDRIQNVNVLQPLYFKPFDLVTLQIETAGSKSSEADLAGISSGFAEYIKNEVLLQKGNEVAPTGTEKPAESKEEIATASLIDLVKYGVSSNGIFWFFIFLAPLVGMADDLLPKIAAKEEFQHFILFLGNGLLGEVLAFVVLLFALLILMFVFSIIGAIFRYFGYSLTLMGLNTREPTLKRTSGLLTRYEESLKLHKIQTVVCQTNLFGRWLKVENLTLGQVSSAQNNARNKKSLFVIPASDQQQSGTITSLVFDDRPDEITSCGIHRRYIAKTLIFKVFLPTVAICLTIFVSTENNLLLAAPFLISLITLPLVIRRWKGYRYGMKNGYGKFQRGLFGFRHILFPLYKVQRAEVRQSPFQRRRKLATLKIYLASNRLQMQYIPIEHANRWMQDIGEAIRSSNKSWY